MTVLNRIAGAGWLLLSALVGVGGYTILTDESLKGIPGPGDDFDIHNGKLLAPILIPRVPGTEGSTKVLKHFTDFFKDELPLWNVTLQKSTSTTPATGNRKVPFVNLVAKRTPPWAKEGEVGYLTLVAHYDSKLEPEGFIGATDSAAPCAMIMHAARSIDDALGKKWARMESEGVGKDGFDGVEEHKGIQVILLDGEEAFESWTATDSIYGARSLAEEWSGTFHAAMSTYQTPLDSISLFVLLDLLGAAEPVVPSYFPTTHWAYQRMAEIEQRLRKAGLFKSSPNHASKRDPDKPVRDEHAFLPEADKQNADFWLGGHIGDDHMPFLARGVEVLHLITSPFPKVWHEIEDDGEHLDMDTVEDWALLTTAFAAEWMDLEGFMPKSKSKKWVKDELNFF